MGIVDDYYGGYESLALFMDSDGGIDYSAAYDAQIPDCDEDEGMDPFDRAFNYKFNKELRKLDKANKRKNTLPGWTDTGHRTALGKPIYGGLCSSCHKQCTVPFAPRASGKPPMCKLCLAAADKEQNKGVGKDLGAVNTEDEPQWQRLQRDQHKESSSNQQPGTSKAAELGVGRSALTSAGALQQDD